MLSHRGRSGAACGQHIEPHGFEQPRSVSHFRCGAVAHHRCMGLHRRYGRAWIVRRQNVGVVEGRLGGIDAHRGAKFLQAPDFADFKLFLEVASLMVLLVIKGEDQIERGGGRGVPSGGLVGVPIVVFGAAK